MNTAAFSIKRPVTIIMIVIGVFIIGFIGYRMIEVALYPDMDLPVVAVVTTYSGTPPEEIEQFITKPIEEQCALVENYDSITSTSSEGISVVAVHFNWGEDMDWATFNTKEKVDQIIESLPDAAGRPTVMKLDTDALSPIIALQVAGIDDMQKLYDICDDDIKPELEKLEGVAAASIYGGLQREIQVNVDWKRLSAYNLDVKDVEDALRAENLNTPAGFTTEGPQEFTLRIVGEFGTVPEINDVVVTTFAGRPVRVRDVATVIDTHKEIRNLSRFNGKPAVSIAITKESDANTVDVSDNVRAAIEPILKKVPPGITLTPVSDQAEQVRNSLENLYEEAIHGGLLAILIIFLFLATGRGTLVVAISIPFSVFATVAFMYFSGMTLNMVTMGGIVLALGRIVDDSIIVLENIFSHLEAGEPVVEACVAGTREMSLAIMAATFTNICVFLPILFVGDLVGAIFSDMSVVVMVGLLCSLVVAITVVPMMSSRLLTRHSVRMEGEASPRHSWLMIGCDVWKLGVDGLERFYRRVAHWGLQNRAAVVAMTLVVFIIAVMFGKLVGFDFFPSMESDDFELTVEAPTDSSIDNTDAIARRVEKIIAAIPEIDTYSVTIGSASDSISQLRGGGVSTATFYVSVIDADKRKRSLHEIQESIRGELDMIPSATNKFVMNRGPGGSDYELLIKGPELDVLSALGEKIKTRLSTVEGLYDVDTDWTAGAPEYQVIVDREKAGRVGLTATSIAKALNTQVQGTTELTKYREGGEEYDITVRARESDRDWIRNVEEVMIATQSGGMVPLSSVATVETTVGPTKVTRDERSRSITVGARVEGRPLSEIVAETRVIVDGMGLPDGYTYEFAGTEENRQDAFGGLGVAFLLGLLLIYIIVGSQFESLSLPILIMLAIPLELIGVLLSLALTGEYFNVMVFLGILMLTGMVVSNSIMLVQMITLFKQRGQTGLEAIVSAGASRLRPILMTVMCTVMAMVPLATATGTGSEMWKGLATAVIGGLLVSTVMTLVVVPVGYSLMEEGGVRIADFFTGKKKRAE